MLFCILSTIIFTVVGIVEARGAPSYLSHSNILPMVHSRPLEMEIQHDATHLQGSRYLKFSQSLWHDTQYRQISWLETGSKFVFLHQVELHFTLRICNNYYSLYTLFHCSCIEIALKITIRLYFCLAAEFSLNFVQKSIRFHSQFRCINNTLIKFRICFQLSYVHKIPETKLGFVHKRNSKFDFGYCMLTKS